MDNGFDFRECGFIYDEMKFIFYDEFYKNAFIIKRKFDNNLSKYGRLFYQWYVYANVHLTNAQKNKIWDYLNGDIKRENLLQQMKWNGK